MRSEWDEYIPFIGYLEDSKIVGKLFPPKVTNPPHNKVHKTESHILEIDLGFCTCPNGQMYAVFPRELDKNQLMCDYGQVSLRFKQLFTKTGVGRVSCVQTPLYTFGTSLTSSPKSGFIILHLLEKKLHENRYGL